MDQINNTNMSSQTRGGQRAPVGGSTVGRRPTPGGMQGQQRQPVTGSRGVSNRMGARGATKSASQQSRQKEGGVKSEKTVDILGKVSAICVFMLFFGLPLFFLNLTYQGIGFEKQYYFYLWTFLGVVAMIAQGMLGGRIEIRRTTLDIPLGILWLVFVIATLFSVDKYHSVFGFFGNPVNGLISVTASILAYYLIVSYISRERISLIWWAITLSGSIVVIWSFLTTMRFVPATILQYISPSLTGSFTSLAVYLGLLLPIFIVSFSLLDGETIGGAKRKILGAALFIVTILDVITLSVLYGYVQWYVILTAIGLLLVFTVSRLVKVSQTTTTMTIVVFLVTFFLWMWGQPIVTRTAIQPEASINYGLSFDIAKEAIKNKPIFGSGPGTYGYNFSLHRPKDLNKSGQYDIRFYSDRGAFMESISTIGLAGMIALVVVMLTYVSTSVHAFMRSQDDEVKIVSLGLFIASIVALIYGMFWAVDGMIILYGILISALTIGLLRGSLNEEDNKLALSMTSSPQHALSFAFLSILVAVGVIFGFVTLGKMFVADMHAGSALKARATGDFVRSSDLFRKAVVLNGQEGRYFTVIGQYGLDLANVELAKPDGERNDEAVAQYITGATGAAGTGKELMPNDVLANETKGFVYENSGGFVSGALAAAMDAYERASNLEPQNPYLDIAIGKLKLVEAQSKGEDAVEEKTTLVNEAKTYFELAEEKTTFEYEGQTISLFAPAHYYISVVEEALGNTDEAIEAMTMALQVTQLTGAGDQQQLLSRQINYGFNLARLLQVRGTEEDMKNAENLLLQIIGVNDQEVNSHLSLGLLYERQGKRDEAVAEYKKILVILPAEDEKARENIQNLIDTVEQGGSNVDANSQNNTENSTPTEEDAESEEDVVEEEIAEEEIEKEVSMVIIRRGDVGDRADQGKNVLSGGGYDAEVREEDESDYEGVTVMYNNNAEREDVRSIEAILTNQFDSVESERNDDEVGTYNHDIVVVIGKEKASDDGE